MKITDIKKYIIPIVLVVTICVAIGIFLAGKSNVVFKEEYNQVFSSSEKTMITDYFDAVDSYVEVIENNKDLINTDIDRFLDKNAKIIDEYEINKEKVSVYGEKYSDYAQQNVKMDSNKLVEGILKKSIQTYSLIIDIQILENLNEVCDNNSIDELKKAVEEAKEEFFVTED